MTDDETKAPLFQLDRSTLVPLGLLVAVVVSSISATVWINTRLLELGFSIQKVNDRLTELQQQVSNGSNDRWTAADMRNWVDLANASNAALKLPEPRHR